MTGGSYEDELRALCAKPRQCRTSLLEDKKSRQERNTADLSKFPVALKKLTYKKRTAETLR